MGKKNYVCGKSCLWSEWREWVYYKI